ncbi:hypothetical protein R1sor_002541 [Riccia sorocarpa]|uniref:Uncharacterized protein n=1 Tax=Riccia sorocarpa TaxID=122646 RepID=A0ABD3H320_9MARC
MAISLFHSRFSCLQLQLNSESGKLYSKPELRCAWALTSSWCQRQRRLSAKFGVIGYATKTTGRGRCIIVSSSEVPDYLPASWFKNEKSGLLGPSSEFTAEEAVLQQLEALSNNDEPYPDHGVEVMYRFAGFDPFQRSQYFGPFFDLGQFERFRRIFHHSTYRVLLGHKERRVLSSLHMSEHTFKQRVWIGGARPGEEEVFEFTLVQRVGGSWDGYWLTDSLRHDGQGIQGGIAY